MAKLQELLQRSVQQNLGLAPTIQRADAENRALRGAIISGEQVKESRINEEEKQSQKFTQDIVKGIEGFAKQEAGKQANQLELDKFELQKRQVESQIDDRTADLELKKKALLQKKELSDADLLLKRDLAKQTRELELKKLENKLLGEDTTKNEDTLRKEINPTIKKFNEVRAAQGKIESGIKQNSAAGDLASIFSFMKVLDPGSTVREGEFANAQNSTGIPGKIRNWYNNAAKGSRLNPAQRKDFIGTAQNLFTEEKQVFTDEFNRFNAIADNRKLDKTNIFGDFNLESITQGIAETPEGAVVGEQKSLITPQGEATETTVTDFTSIQAVEAANLPIGTEITINGRKAVIE